MHIILNKLLLLIKHEINKCLHFFNFFLDQSKKKFWRPSIMSIIKFIIIMTFIFYFQKQSLLLMNCLKLSSQNLIFPLVKINPHRLPSLKMRPKEHSRRKRRQRRSPLRLTFNCFLYLEKFSLLFWLRFWYELFLMNFP